MNPKAAEAELISKATQTAIIAARSILMSGGTEESALKTAKAAAESVLNPAASDCDTVSGRSALGSAFGGRKRKAKRQAEVVASMALMSATSLHANGNSMMSECDSLNKMYGRNIITVRQDEPSVLSNSVLSNSTRPKPITPKSFGMMEHRTSFRSLQEETREQTQIPTYPQLNQESVASPQSILSNTLNNILPNAVEGEDENMNVHPTLNVNTLSASSSEDSDRGSSVQSSFLCRTNTDDDYDDDNSSLHYREKKVEKVSAKSKAKTKGWSLSELLMSPLTATMNMLHCGQINSSDAVNDVEFLARYDNKKKSKPSKRSFRREPTFDRRDDTFDDEKTSSDYRESPKKKGVYRDSDFMGSYSYTSSHSEISDASEGDIKVRSSIRDTMESIVNKSRLSYRKSKQDAEWNTFEMKSTSPKGSVGRPPSPSPKKNKRPPKGITPSVRRRAQSFFKRDKGRKQNGFS